MSDHEGKVLAELGREFGELHRELEATRAIANRLVGIEPRLAAAEADNAALRAEVERLKAENTECRRLLIRRVEASRLDEANTRLAAAEARVQKAITWLVTVRADQPASIIADRARLALEALRD